MIGKNTKENCIELIGKLRREQILTKEEYLYLIQNRDECAGELKEQAGEVRDEVYGKRIFIRGLIEFTNYCRNDCIYCGIRRGNHRAERFRLSAEEIISCADAGYELGFRTFVLQGGEDPFFTDEKMCAIIRALKERHPDCAVTLSLGERSDESYRAMREAGADRYLLRHETASKELYGKLHPAELSWDNRIRCLHVLREMGYQIGAGFMVSPPFQTEEMLAEEMHFLKELNPDMCGIGPFIPHKDTPFAGEAAGTVELTLFMLGLIRLTLPRVLLPATTALGTIHPRGREMGVEFGANVVMPNLSPAAVRGKYLLYDNKICTGDEAAQCIECMKTRMRTTGCEIVVDRGDSLVR